MKKWLISVCFILLLATLAIYIIIPEKLIISESVTVNCNVNSASRFLSNMSNWAKWWPKNAGISYRLVGYSPSVIDLVISLRNSEFKSRMILIPGTLIDSTALTLESILHANLNPITRVRQFQESRVIAKTADSLLVLLRSCLEKTENVYGTNIRVGSTDDSFLVATKKDLPYYPSTETLYLLLKDLKSYISAQRGIQTGYPMVNITKSGAGDYMTMVAIPVNRELQQKGEFFPRKLVSGKYLITEVRGGSHAVSEGLGQLQNYIDDNHLTTMAIPFQSLLTDRAMVSDSAKWITRLYFPVF